MCSIIQETLVTFNPPCCCARPVETFSSRPTDKCALVPVLAHIFFFLFTILSSRPCQIVSVPLFLWVTDWVQWQPQQESHIEKRQNRELWLTPLCVHVCVRVCARVSELILCASVIASCLSVGAFVIFVISSVGMEVCSAHECVSHISTLRV